MIPGTPQEYANIYIDCWSSELEKRPKLVQILNDLDNLSTETICKVIINDISYKKIVDYSELNTHEFYILCLNEQRDDNQEASSQILVMTVFHDAKQNVSKIEFDKESLMNKSEEVKSNDIHALESS
ncbi:2307_t:CDS:2, partial [Dentiscutata erythropus]